MWKDRSHYHRCAVKVLFLVAIIVVVPRVSKSQAPEMPSPPPTLGKLPVINVNSELVVVPVSVTDSHGSFVHGLTEKQFRIFDNHKVQKLTLFREEDTDVSIGLVVDHSGSMRAKLPIVIESATALAKLGNSYNEMFMVQFNDQSKLQAIENQAITKESEEISLALRSTPAFGRTALYDSVAAAIDHLQSSRNAKKALVLMSDGGDNASSYSRSEIIALARRSQVTIYAIVLLKGSDGDQNPKLVTTLCNDTGGLAFVSTSPETISASVQRIAEDLREQYTLGFIPESDTSTRFHKLRVVLNVNELQTHIRTRVGYSRAGKP